jgi:hypothetical protein
MKTKKIIILNAILIVFFSLLLIIMMVLALEESAQIIPLFGLETGTHRFIFWGILPITGSILAVLLFPRVFAPLFLKAKRKIYFRYEDVYLEGEPAALTKRMFIIRSIYILLLTMGIMAFIIPLIDVSKLLSLADMAGYTAEGIIPMYAMSSIAGVIGFILPIVVGLWSIGWAMEDAGLIHHRLDDRRPGKLFEIEPIHIKYNSYLKGYAGITAILFIIEVSLYFVQQGGSRVSDAIFAFIVPILSIILAIPSYIVYAKVMGKNAYLREGLKEIRKLSKEDISKE